MDCQAALLRCLYVYVALSCSVTELASGAGLPPAAANLKELTGRRRRALHTLIRLNPNADRREKSLQSVNDVHPTLTIVRSNVIGGAIPRITKVVDSSFLEDTGDIANLLSTTPATERTTARQQLGAGARLELQQPEEQYRSQSPVPQHRRPPTLYPRDHESCRREMREVVVRRGGCRKRVSIGVCTGTCLSSPVVVRKHPYVNYQYTSCRPKDSTSVEVSMNDLDCQQQRSEKGRQEREKAYNDVFLLSAVSCSCFSLPSIDMGA